MDIPMRPLPLQLQLPPIPGMNLPLTRLVEHLRALQTIRNLAHFAGFQSRSTFVCRALPPGAPAAEPGCFDDATPHSSALASARGE